VSASRRNSRVDVRTWSKTRAVFAPFGSRGGNRRFGPEKPAFGCRGALDDRAT
jgi:hypothetical protein